MEVLDYVRSGALIVAFLSTAFAGRRIWMLADTIGTLFFGASFLLFPRAVLGYLVESSVSLTFVHEHYGRILGVMLIGLGLISHFSRSSNDDAVIGTLLLSRLLGGAVMTVTIVVSHFNTPWKKDFSQANLTFFLLSTALWTLGNLIQVLRAQNMRGGVASPRGRLSNHLLFDLMLFAGGTIYLYGFPDHIFKVFILKDFSPDGVMYQMVRVIGSLDLMLLLFGFGVFGFRSDIEKGDFLLVKLFVVGTLTVMAVYYQYMHHLVNRGTMLGGLAFYGVFFVNLVFGYLAAKKTKSD